MYFFSLYFAFDETTAKLVYFEVVSSNSFFTIFCVPIMGPEIGTTSHSPVQFKQGGIWIMIGDGDIWCEYQWISKIEKN